MNAKTKAVGQSADKVGAALDGLGLQELFAGWTNLVQSLDQHAHTEAKALLEAADTMGVLSLGDHIEKQRPGPMTIALLVKLAIAQQKSISAAAAASMKNASERLYAAEQWRNRTDLGQCKASCARMLVAEVNRRFRVKLTADHIARYWLKD